MVIVLGFETIRSQWSYQRKMGYEDFDESGEVLRLRGGVLMSYEAK